MFKLTKKEVAEYLECNKNFAKLASEDFYDYVDTYFNMNLEAVKLSCRYKETSYNYGYYQAINDFMLGNICIEDM